MLDKIKKWGSLIVFIGMLIVLVTMFKTSDNINSRFATIDLEDVTATATEVNTLTSVTGGTISASKAVVLNSSSQIDDWNVADDVWVGDDSKFIGFVTLPTTTSLSLSVGSSITPTSSVARIGSATTAITLTSTPSISITSISDGTILYLIGTDTTNKQVTLQDESVLTGTKMLLDSSNVTLKQYTAIQMLFDSTSGYWQQIGRSSNPSR